MSLLTPPKTSHREEKENRAQASVCRSSSSSRVVWAQHNQIHNLASPPRARTTSTAAQDPPTKSILKKSSYPLLPLENDSEQQRESTPAPTDPLNDSSYLKTPVSTIIDSENLHELIEAYSVLAARLRPYVSEKTDASCGILTPLKENRKELVKSIVRDLERPLVDPVASMERDPTRAEVFLPSPTKSPKKKRGMTAEQAKFARDLCTLSHSVLKFLGLAFTIPAIFKVFTDAHLREMITGLLAIPLAQELPTPNARKTCALAICVIQTQRLPHSVLAPAADRIAYALRRGIDGELGKEGKRGSASDGLKAIHDMSIYDAELFVPAFSTIVDSILANLLAPNLVLRIQACHALGGLALACAETAPTVHHTRISAVVAEFILTIPIPSPSKSTNQKSSPSKSPSKSPDPESRICRTLRTTLENEAPPHPAHGPVWALSVLASFAVLLGPALFKDQRLSRTVAPLMLMTLRHKKSSVRVLTYLVWRSLIWAHFQPSYPDTEGETDETEDQSPASTQEARRNRFLNWKLMQQILNQNNGLAIVAACVNTTEQVDGVDVRNVVQLLQTMMKKGFDTFRDALHVINRLLSGDADTSKATLDANFLLPTSLFSGVPGLLTVEFSNLQVAVREVQGECTNQGEMIRPFSREELSEGALEEFFGLWQRGAYLHEMLHDDPDLLKHVWSSLLNAALIVHEDGSEECHNTVAKMATDTLRQLLSGDIHLGTPESGAETSGVHMFAAKCEDSRSSFARMLKLVMDVWIMTRETLPSADLSHHAESLLNTLIDHEEEMNEHMCRTEWGTFCVELALCCDSIEMFWRIKWEWSNETRSRVWEIFVQNVRRDSRTTWDDIVFLLNVPFGNACGWNLDNDELQIWEGLVDVGLEKARDKGFADSEALSQISENISQPSFNSCARVAEILLKRCQLSEDEDLPFYLIEFITDTLRSSYPPSPSEITSSLWMIRALVEMIDTCPRRLAQQLLESLHEGISVWVADERKTMSLVGGYGDVVTLYETVMVSLRSIPHTLETFETFSPFLEVAFLGRADKPQEVVEAFDAFWEEAKYSKVVPDNEWPEKIQEHFGVEMESASPDLPPSSPPSSDDGFEDKTPAHDIRTLLPLIHRPSTPENRAPSRTPITPCSPAKTPITLGRYTPISTPPTPSLSSRHTTPRDAVTLVRSPLFSPVANKRRRMDNKENESPQALLGSPSKPLFASPTRKRRLSDEGDDDRSVKRPRVDLATLASLPKFTLPAEEKEDVCDDEGAVEKMLILQDEPQASPQKDVFGAPLTSTRKRKAMMLDSVEVPTLREVQRLRNAAKMGPKDIPQTPQRDRTLARLYSSPGTIGVTEYDSDGSIIDSDSPVPSQLSSDDDPHLGQVTPHHLISPAIRRAQKCYDEDPPSDDSVISASPSKGALLRRMQRLGTPKPLARLV